MMNEMMYLGCLYWPLVLDLDEYRQILRVSKETVLGAVESTQQNE